jgi:hypothetical protein
MEQKIIFLDIDGVIEVPNLGAHFDADCCRNLKEILKATSAKIVISSSWRDCECTINLLYEYLEEQGITKDEVVGFTPTLSGSFQHLHGGWDSARLRWREIQKYIIVNHVKNYVIIDDYDLTAYATKNFVKTKKDVGLTAELKDICIEILGRAV